jgi:predicted RNA-binding Zn-ribbon protein involved in translation (DUF1610 family)
VTRRASRDPDQLQLVPTPPLPACKGYQLTEADVRRLWARIAPPAGTECRESGWAKTSRGYTVFWAGNAMHKVHRLVYLLERGDIPSGMHVHHLCHNPGCCNSAHLELLAHSEHARLHAIESNGNHAAAMHRARTHCRRCGHLLMRRKKTADKRGYERQCPTCARDLTRASRQRRRHQQLLTTTAP